MPRGEFLDSDDMADACVYLMGLPNMEFQPLLASVRNDGLLPVINIGVGADVTFMELAELVKSATGYQGDNIIDTSKPDGMQRKLMDVGQLSALEWNAPTNLYDGIFWTFESFLDKQ